MNRCSNPSYAGDKSPDLPGIAVFDDQLKAPPHGARRPSIGHLTAFDLGFDSQVTFYSGNRINRDLWDLFLSFLVPHLESVQVPPGRAL